MSYNNSNNNNRALLPPENPLDTTNNNTKQNQQPLLVVPTLSQQQHQIDDDDEGYITQSNNNQPISSNNNNKNNNNTNKHNTEMTSMTAIIQVTNANNINNNSTTAADDDDSNTNPVKTQIPLKNRWQTKIIYDEVVPMKECLFGFCCSQCAQASAKSDLDGTHFLYNCCCWHHGMTYSWLRIEYGIKSNCGSDMMSAIFCACCSGRRILSESRIRIENGEKIQNTENEKPEWIEQMFSGFTAKGLAQACCCAPCQAHEARMFLRNPEDLDCCFDVMCFNPMAMHGHVRHRYKIRSAYSSPLVEDMVLPCVCLPCALNRAVRESRSQKGY